MMPIYSVTICSDDNTLAGNVEYVYALGGTISYIARIWDIRHVKRDGTDAKQIEARAFGNGVQAENWMLDKIECPLFTLLAK
jgi:hypothetical protein